MYENKYDEKVFFEKYGQMLRSQKGLAGAAEWGTLRGLLPSFEGKRVLDLGCGYGWHCIYAAQQGALRVVGVDISEKMLEIAREKTKEPQVEYLRLPMEEIAFEKESFDLVLSSLALHYVADFEGLLGKIHGLLVPGGTLVFSVEHPVFTAQGPQDWCYGEKGEILHYPVDSYFYEGERQAVFLGEPVVK